jgi:hypothetical protein
MTRAQLAVNLGEAILDLIDESKYFQAKRGRKPNTKKTGAKRGRKPKAEKAAKPAKASKKTAKPTHEDPID